MVFWASAAGLGYSFGGYHLLIKAAAELRKRLGWPWREGQLAAQAGYWPRVSVVLAAREEQERIGQRLENLLESDYPGELLEILVVSDGSTDETVSRVEAVGRESGAARVRCLANAERQGKAGCLNQGVAAAEGEVIVFCDARQRFERDVIRRLARGFADPRVGAVSGNLRIAPTMEGGAGGGVEVYWVMEKFLRRAEGEFDASVGCTGAVYAVRRGLYRAIPADTLLDDVVIPMQVAEQGYRVLFDAAAVAWDPQELRPELEKRRKRRTLAGNFQMLWRYRHWLLPGPRGHRLWWQLISHKYLRLAGPVFLAGCLVGNVRLAGCGRLYKVFLLGQLVFYGLAGLGLTGCARSKATTVPAGFVFLNYQVLQGLVYYARSRRGAGW